MAEDAVVTAEVPDDSGDTATANPGSRSHAATLHDEVNRLLKDKSAVEVRQRVVNTLVEEKLEERKKMVLDGLGKLKTQRQEIEKLKRGGQQDFGLDKQPLGPMRYTKQQAEEIEKATQKADKLEKALDKAINDGDYGKLQECSK